MYPLAGIRCDEHCDTLRVSRTFAASLASLSSSLASFASRLYAATGINGLMALCGALRRQLLHLAGPYFAVGLCLEVLVQLFVQPLVVLDAPDIVQPSLAHLLSGRAQPLEKTARSEDNLCSMKLNASDSQWRHGAHMVTSMSGSWLMLSAASREFSTSSLIVVYRHLPGCACSAPWHAAGPHANLVDWHMGNPITSTVHCRTLSKPAMFLFSAKNSAGLLCSRVSAFATFLPMPTLALQTTSGSVCLTRLLP